MSNNEVNAAITAPQIREEVSLKKPSTNTQHSKLKEALIKYRFHKKTGPALYQLITILKEKLPKFESEKTQTMLAEINASENEIKMLQNHWDRPKKYFR